MREFFRIGKILKAHGLRGEVSVIPLAGQPERFDGLKSCRLENPDGSFRSFINLERVSYSDASLYIQFSGIRDRGQAEQLNGLFLSVPRAEAIPLEADHWYISDLIGCSVRSEKEGQLGEVSDILQGAAHDTLEIRADGCKAIYVPFMKCFLKSVKIEERLIEMELPDGLFELYRGSK